jgi:predicted ATP-grasp superfamily ATP-dependent carboligase
MRAHSTVLLTDVQERGALAALRGLAEAGYRVAGAATTRPAQGHWSRYCAERIVVPDPREDTEAYAERLERLLTSKSFAIVLPGTDASLRVISEHRDRLDTRSRLGLPSKESVRRSLDKLHLLEAAAQSGMPAPRSIVCADEVEARHAIRELGVPVVVKPNTSRVVLGKTLRSQVSHVVVGEGDLGRVLMEMANPFVLQRFEPSSRVLSCAGVMGEERLLAFAASTYVRKWPPQVGSVSHSMTVTVPDSLMRKIENLMAHIGWQGIFELELLVLAEDRIAAIDLNPRVYGSLALAIRAGANLPVIWCDWLMGYETQFVVARPGVYYRWEDGEFLNFVLYLSKGRVRRAVSCLRPHKNTVHAGITLRDPLPLLARVLWVAGRLGRRVVAGSRHS